MADRYIQVYDSPPPGKSIRVRDVDEQNPIAQGDVATAKWSVEMADGTLVRMTTAELLANISTSALVLPTYAVRVEYPMNAPFIFEGALYRVKVRILGTNTKTVAQLLADDEVEKIADGDAIPRSEIEKIAAAQAKARYSDDEKAEVAKIQEIVDKLNNLSGNVNFAVLNWRGGKPRPPFKSQVEDFNKGLVTIGIDLDGVLWTLKDTPAGDAEGVWIDFDTTNWQFEHDDVVPNSALETGDYYYRYDDDVWVLFDGTKQIVYYDRDISAFLPNHIFLGQFANADAATESIRNYDGTKTYLAYFTVTVSGRTGKQVRQLQSYNSGTAESISWVSTNETLNHLSDELHKLIQENKNQIAIVKGDLGEEEPRIRNNARAISDLETEQDTQDTLIQRNSDNIPEQISDTQALEGAAREGYLSPRQVRLNVLAAYVKEVSDDPELDTINRRYAVLSYDQTAYDADNLEFGQMMFNNATLTSATKVKIGYVDEGKPTQLFGGLNADSKIELWAINAPHEYEEPFNAYESQITAAVRTIRPAINAISTIELTLSTAPEITVGVGPNTSYILAVSGKFKNRVAPEIQDADRGKILGVKTDKNELEYVDKPGGATNQVVLDWDETRNADGFTLPANFADYGKYLLVVRDRNDREVPLTYPTKSLTDPRRDSSDTNTAQLGDLADHRFTFNRTSRILTPAGGNQGIQGVVYFELF